MTPFLPHIWRLRGNGESSENHRLVPWLGFGCTRLPNGQDRMYIEDEIQEIFDYTAVHSVHMSLMWQSTDQHKMAAGSLFSKNI